jgi:hypothetical protein
MMMFLGLNLVRLKFLYFEMCVLVSKIYEKFSFSELFKKIFLRKYVNKL